MTEFSLFIYVLEKERQFDDIQDSCHPINYFVGNYSFPIKQLPYQFLPTFLHTNVIFRKQRKNFPFPFFRELVLELFIATFILNRL